MSFVLSETKPCPEGFECGRNAVCFVDYQMFPDKPICQCELGTTEKDGKCTGKCSTQIYRALYGDAMLVPMYMGTNIAAVK